MNKIITIGREFGSGGRELGRKLSEILKFAYYDREIISEISKRTSLSEKYIQNIAEHKPVIPFPIHTGRTFWAVVPDFGQSVQSEQHNIIREVSEKSDCVIVGRGADYILRELNPFRIFVYSDDDSKIKRCRENQSHDYEKGSELSEKELAKRISQINKSRADYYEFYTGLKWGDKANYDLCVNTTKINPEKFAEIIAEIFLSKC
ncbi:MAG: cytidylate kinase-like family protein [Synergistaceae bacterium]|nr:cytidylate kinase-like family protein [Synergistaceae bacterium]